MNPLYSTFSTNEGRLIRVFEELYKKYKDSLPERLHSINVVIKPNIILFDPGMYRRLMKFYNEEAQNDETL